MQELYGIKNSKFKSALIFANSVRSRKLLLTMKLPFEARYTLTLQAAVAVWYWDASDRVQSVSHGQPLAPVSFMHLGYVSLICSHWVTALERFRENGVVIVEPNKLPLAACANSSIMQEPGNYRVVPRAPSAFASSSTFEFSTDALRLLHVLSAELLFSAFVKYKTEA